MITNYILAHTSRLNPQTEVSAGGELYKMFNDGGVEIEVAEFLYSLVRMIKPMNIVETGTHLGISALYMALGLHQNQQQGKLTTFEIIPELRREATLLWVDLNMQQYIHSKLQQSLQGLVEENIDLLFLDSEPQLRFDEFLRFWDKVVPGGIILIHDLHPSFGHHGQTYHGVYDWPYGDFREKMGPYLKSGDIQTVHFKTPRGFTLFQKIDPSFEYIKYVREG